METTQKPLFEYKRFGFELAVYENRVTIIDKSGGIKGFAAPKQTDILVKNITGINIKGMTRALEFTMNDGTLRKIPVYGKDAEAIRREVLSLL